MADKEIAQEVCEERMRKLEEDCEKAILRETAAAEARVKLWLLGCVLALGVTLGGGLVCGIVEVGSYREKVVQSQQDLQQLKTDLHDHEREDRRAP